MSTPSPNMLACKCQQKRPKFCFCLVGATIVKMHNLVKKQKKTTISIDYTLSPLKVT